MPEPKFRVAIIGGGIGGLALTLALTPYNDIEINIYEGAAQFEEIGAGIGIYWRGLTVLAKLGLDEKVRAVSGAPPGKAEYTILLRRSDQTSEGEDMGQFVLSTAIGAPRTALLDLLVKLLSETGRANTYFGKCCVSFTQNAENLGSDGSSENFVTVRFMDGTSATCDLLVGCDGIKSVTRGQLMCNASGTNRTEETGRYAETKFSGSVTYRGSVKPEELKAIKGEHRALTERIAYCGKNKHIVSYPVGGRFVNIVAYVSDPSKQQEWASGPWEVDVGYKELLEHYRNFEPDVQGILKCIHKTSRWAMYDVDPLPFWTKGRVTCMGHAAHGMTPFLGVGSGQGFEDAYILSKLLGSPNATRDTLPSTLLAYENVRMPIANCALLSTREAGSAFEFMGKYEGARNEMVVQGLRKLSEWLLKGNGDPDDEVQEAMRLFQELDDKRKP